MSRDYRRTKWTYNGIKRFYPHLSFDEWLGITRRGDHYYDSPKRVVLGVGPEYR